MASSPTQEGLLNESRLPENTKPSEWQRKLLLLQALIWRFLAKIGFALHGIPNPKPPRPSFLRYYFSSTTMVDKSEKLELAFYVPGGYHSGIEAGKRYPTVLNFHGGGFTMGTTTDDARWAAMTVDKLHAIVVSVQYRLAPEHPFPTAVEDGAAALLWLGSKAHELGIDTQRIGLTGFSAGANLVFTIPISLFNHHQLGDTSNLPEGTTISGIKAIVSWYPGLDYRLSRAERRATCVRPEKTLPPALTNLFDRSYLPDPEQKRSPLVSPAAADHKTLKEALPKHIGLYLCEWDMLQREGAEFAQRLTDLGKQVECITVQKRRHAFDKSPWPFSVDPEITKSYEQACDFLGSVL